MKTEVRENLFVTFLQHQYEGASENELKVDDMPGIVPPLTTGWHAQAGRGGDTSALAA